MAERAVTGNDHKADLLSFFCLYLRLLLIILVINGFTSSTTSNNTPRKISFKIIFFKKSCFKCFKEIHKRIHWIFIPELKNYLKYIANNSIYKGITGNNSAINWLSFYMPANWEQVPKHTCEIA